MTRSYARHAPIAARNLSEGEPLGWARLALIVALVGCIAGLKLASH